MVGGIVKETVQCDYGDDDKRTWVNCQGTGSERREECAIYVKPNRDIKPGDRFWWQGGTAFWTPVPERKGRIEIRLERIGFSGVSRPESQFIEGRVQ